MKISYINPKFLVKTLNPSLACKHLIGSLNPLYVEGDRPPDCQALILRKSVNYMAVKVVLHVIHQCHCRVNIKLCCVFTKHTVFVPAPGRCCSVVWNGTWNFFYVFMHRLLCFADTLLPVINVCCVLQNLSNPGQSDYATLINTLTSTLTCRLTRTLISRLSS